MAINWTNIYKKYKGMWIALKQDEITVIASGNSAKVAYSNALKKGLENPILSYIPSKVIPMVG